MQLETIDWIIICGYFLIVITIGIAVSRISGKDTGQFFLGGRKMPWWLLGFSMVATTFSTDTPNLVTDIVRQDGVAGNWAWWAFLVSGMVTVFLYSKLWRRSGVMTDIEFYEMRYSGKSAAFLRGFRALYLGLLFNVMVMATVSLAAIKIGGVMLGASPLQSILWALIATAIFSSIGGFRSVVFTDFLLFGVAMVGSIAAAYFAIGHEDIGSLKALFEHPALEGKLSFFPEVDKDENGAWSDESLNAWATLITIPLLVQWWSVWYPGSEPGGGGYVAQRMLAAKNEKHATGAVLFFNFAHYGLRPWPWILVALASLVVFPSLESIQEAFPHVDPRMLGHDLAYPAMLTFLPNGWLGLVIASLIAAYMSTISTQTNGGSFYIVNDFYKRFVNPDATEKKLVLVGRISTIVMMVLAGYIALQLRTALDTFKILLQVGAGTGLIFLLRWYWWRINAFSEISAMVSSLLIAVFFRVADLGFPWWLELLIGVSATSIVWFSVTLLTSPSERTVLERFYLKVRPAGPGWSSVRSRIGMSIPESDPLAPQFVNVALGIAAVYGFLFGIGKMLYGETVFACCVLTVSGLFASKLVRSESRGPDTEKR
ncbi:sodium:solute symporter family protein [Pelagicoccus mobilis]|uniref:Na+:solute symporter n=1 Tax=Pelagicoccus mobilis TaxID=415221 RepID=A0A934RXT0_9BACT|nr:sodium:solute symporter family protein [Pelagicoccus mobilis]MBK1875844.1 Na+:solute symporter [Pelagicoccus mobilis]